VNRECNLTKRIKTTKGPRYCPVVYSNNGRVKPDAVLVAGREEKHTEGSYYIEWREGTQRKRARVGKDAQFAATQQLKKESELNARNHGHVIAAEASIGRPLSAAIVEYLEEIKLSKKPKTYAAYSTALRYFQESCSKTNLEDLDRKDLLKFSAFLRDEKELSARTVNMKFGCLMIFLKAQDIRGLAKKTDWPSFTEEEPEIYEREDLDTLFAACDAQERLWFEFFLITGIRDQEVMHAYWSDVNFFDCTVSVTHKPDFRWTPKAYKEREIPIPAKLASALKARKAASDKTCPLIFPTARCKPKLDFLDCLKICAERAKLDREHFWLHKFRATFATWSLWAGVDLRTVQSWLGHSDLESTMRYLKPSRNQAVRDKVNEIFV
jgi:integrase